MRRKISTGILILLTALPAFGNVPKLAPLQPQPALHLMNDAEFAQFLQQLDSGLVRWSVQLKSLNLRTLGLDPRETKELERSQNRCLQALENTRAEIEELSRKQTLKLDFLLLVDLNDLARNLDGLNRDLADPLSAGDIAARKSLAYAKQVLNIDTALTPRIGEFQQHVLAFAEVMDAMLQLQDRDANQSPGQK